MVQVSKQFYTRQDAIAQWLAKTKSTSTNTQSDSLKNGTYTPKGREINDTISLSGGSKIVNIGRGFDLAEQVRNEKDPTKLRDLIKAGSEDIRRIGRLFFEVGRGLTSLFGRSR